MNNQAFELLKDAIDELKSDVRDIKKDLGHYKGFVGGVMFAFTALWSFMTYYFTRGKPDA